MRTSRLTIASIVLLLFTTTTIGCRYGCEDDRMVMPTRDVVVAAEAIGQGLDIEPEMLALRSVPLDEPNSMAFTDAAPVLGRVAAVDIPQFQMITPNLLVDE